MRSRVPAAQVWRGFRAREGEAPAEPAPRDTSPHLRSFAGSRLGGSLALPCPNMPPSKIAGKGDALSVAGLHFPKGC